ncbi:hypothetical protein D3C86_2045150 [compost metagenome]
MTSGVFARKYRAAWNGAKPGEQPAAQLLISGKHESAVPVHRLFQLEAQRCAEGLQKSGSPAVLAYFD